MIELLGVPFDQNSSFKRGAAQGPRHVRQALHCGSTNLCAESGIDLSEDRRWSDAGDVDFRGNAPEAIERRVTQLLENDGHVVSVGGDHSISYPIARAYHGRFPGLNLVQLDAHPDLYNEYEGNRFSNACPFARIMEEGLASRLVQIGIRTLNPHQREQAERFGVEILELRDHGRWELPRLDGPTYLSIDLDVLDPAFAPGVSHHEPGGLSSREVLDIIQGLDVSIVGADIVELNPSRDRDGVTAMLAAKLVKEVVARMLGPR